MGDGERDDVWHQLNDVEPEAAKGPYVAGEVGPVDPEAPAVFDDGEDDGAEGLGGLVADGDEL